MSSNLLDLGSKSPSSCNIIWFRRDLRLDDNAALYAALKSDKPVLPLFIFDSNILDKLKNKADARVQFIHESLQQMQLKLRELGSDLIVLHGNPLKLSEQLFKELKIERIYTNHDYEPYALERDEAIAKLCAKNGAELMTFKDQCIFEKKEVVKDDGQPYVVFTPYKKKYLSLLEDFYLKSYPTSKYFKNFAQIKKQKMPDLRDIGFIKTNQEFPKSTTTARLVQNYKASRDFPAVDGTSHLGLHLRFGTISIRKLASFTKKHSETFLSELIWRDFFMQILFHYPHVAKGPFRKEYADIQWRNDKTEFKKWCEGKTGYPIVDAGMRELNETGYMHNRVRMIVASFLTKHLLIDWRWGEAYFAEKLLDFDLAANNGNWQWAAGCGCDAAPYFRVFNPETQTEKFDPDQKYIKKWVPELGTEKYPEPIVEHKFARERAIKVYKQTLA